MPVSGKLIEIKIGVHILQEVPVLHHLPEYPAGLFVHLRSVHIRIIRKLCLRTVNLQKGIWIFFGLLFRLFLLYTSYGSAAILDARFSWGRTAQNGLTTAIIKSPL